MIQGHDLHDARDVSRLPLPIRRALVPPSFEAIIPCEGAHHPVRVIDGIPSAVEHDDEGERALRALGANDRTCMRARTRIQAELSQVRPHSDFSAGTEEFPTVLARLVALAAMRRLVVATSWNSSAEEVARLTRSVARGFAPAVRLRVGEGPTLVDGERMVLTLPIEWLATVWATGLETYHGDPVAGLEPSGDAIVVTTLPDDEPLTLQRVTIRPTWLRFLARSER